MSPKISILIICALILIVCSQTPGQLDGLVTGSIYLAAEDLVNPNIPKLYSYNLKTDFGDGSLTYALALAGFQTLKTQQLLTVLISQIMFVNTNTAITFKVQFNPKGSLTYTTWLKLKWTYLVVSSTFDSTYSNIWATSAELNPASKSIVNIPIDSIGSAFLVVGGEVGDCDIFVDPLLQLDIPHCLKVPANGQYIGGKPIIHAYIYGFSATTAAYPDGSSVSVSKGNSTNLYSDSEGWEIVYSSPPNGPKVSIPASGGLTYIQISFLFVRMDYYANGYPMNSKLQYSSSHVFTAVNQYNIEVALAKGDGSSYNQNFIELPDATYLLYGLSAFTFNSLTNSTLFSVMVNMDKNSYWVISPSNSIQTVTVSADMFIKNVMQLCNAKQKEISVVAVASKSNITPKIAAYTAVDVSQLVPLSELSSNPNAIAYRYGTGSSVSKQLVTFTNSFTFSPPSASGFLRLQLLIFEKISMQSLVQNAEYNVKMSSNDEELVNYKLIYHNTPNVSYRSSPFQKAVKVLTSSVNFHLTVSFSSSQSSQQLYLLLAATYQPILYDPVSSQCLTSCPASSSGVNGDNYPLTCIYCNSEAGFLYSTLAATCVCKISTYVNTDTMSCLPCVANCSLCVDHSVCTRCQNSFFLLNGQCISSCPPSTVSFVNQQQTAICQPCGPLCATCSSSPNFCTSCTNGTYLYMSTTNQTCLYTCPQGTLTDGRNCQPCHSSCSSCAGSPSYCLKCSGSLLLSKGTCLQNYSGIITNGPNGPQCIDSCPDGSFLVGNRSCSPCSIPCATCDFTALNCTSCKVGVLADFGVCVNSCAESQFILGRACFNCSTNCQQCFRRADNCIKCFAGMLLSAGKCIHACATDQYFSQTHGVCMACKRGCGSCINKNECLTCKNAQIVPFNGKCPFCGGTCLLCDTDGRCLRCQSSSYLFNGACLSSCPGITVPINGLCSCPMGVLQDGACVSSCASGNYNLNGMCKLCDSNCLECLGSSNNCVSCLGGWGLSEGKCVAETGCMYGQHLMNGQCTNICTNNTYFLEGVCFYQKCKQGYSPNSYGGCVRTPIYQCKQGHYYYQGNCISTCPLALYADFFSQQCLKCPSNCDSCINTFQCFTCAKNYSNIDGICYFSNCANDSVSVGSSCASSCPNGTKKQGSVCVRRCTEGSYYFKDFCYLSCPSNSNNGYACSSFASPK